MGTKGSGSGIWWPVALQGGWQQLRATSNNTK